ncbi:MAG: substrate-binding domain-containing protein, partial [Caldilinea sp.]
MTKHRQTDQTIKARPTIGFLNSDIEAEWALLPWLGMVDAARQHDVTLVTCVGKIINWAYNFEKQANVLYTLINGERLDGLIIWKAGVVMNLSEPEIEAFCHQYNVPVVTLEGTVRGYPSVVYGNYQGMRAAIEHLIEIHGYRRIGFMGLHEHHVGFRERYRAYTDAMAAHGLPVQPALVKPSWSDRDILTGGRESERALTAWLRQALAAGMEALAGVCDTVTIRVLNTLQTMGVSVPDEVALVSFDDFAEGQVISPPLTTVKPSWYELGRVAVETLIGILAGRPVPEQIIVPSQLMVRQSCGCLGTAVIQASAEPVEQPARLPSWEMALDQVIPEMIQAARANAV